MQKKRVFVFAAGTKDGGGSGVLNLYDQARVTSGLNYEIIGVSSNHENGGVRRKAEGRIPFRYFSSGTWSAEEYRSILNKFEPDLVALSGWLKPVRGIPAAMTINIHPGRLPAYGGKHMHGDAVHAAVLKNKEKFTAVTMHFVPDYDDVGYDRGPVFFEKLVPVLPDDTVETLRTRVNAVEHQWQPYLTHLVAHGYIALKEGQVKVPLGYPFVPQSA